MNATGSVPQQLAALVPRRVQKASVDDSLRLLLELFGGEPAGKAWITLFEGSVAVASARPPGTGATPPALQGLVRKELVPALLASVECAAPGLLSLRFLRPDGAARVLLVEQDADDARAVLCAETADGLRVLATLGGAARPKDGRDLRRGRLYQAPKTPPRRLVSSTNAAGVAGGDGDVAARQLARATQLRSQLRSQLRGEQRRLARLASALEGDLRRHGDAERWQTQGELLKTALTRAPRGTAVLEVTDFEGQPYTLTLDAALDAKDNLTRLFRRARRAREAVARCAPRLAAVRLSLAELDDARARLQDQPSDADLDHAARALDQAAGGAAAPSTRRRVARASKRQPWRCFRAHGDVVVRVGRGARDNDALVRDARGNDVWLHARAVHGAHVVIPSRGEDIGAELLLDAAHLAAHFSAARGEARVDVQHTRVKHLKKPGPGAPAGLVHVTQESVLHLRVDEARLRRLLAAEVPA